MFICTQNHVRLAVAKIGGPTKTSNLLGCSNGAVHAWIKKGRVADIDMARKLADLAGVSVEQVRPVL